MREFLYQKELCISSSIEGLNCCLDMVESIKNFYNLDFDKSFGLQTVMVEAVENAIIHGNKSDVLKLVKVRLKVDVTEFFIEIEDEGEGFNMANYIYPIEVSNLTREGGRGLFFIRKLSKEAYTIERGNILRIIIDR